MLSEFPTKHASSSLLLSSSFGYVLLCKLTNNGLPFKRFLKFKSVVNPFAPGDFAEKTRFEASRVVFWSLSCYKELKLTTNWFTGRTLCGLLIQMQNISLQSSGMLIFFSLAGQLLGLILVGRVFRKAFSILGLGERKGR